MINILMSAVRRIGLSALAIFSLVLLAEKGVAAPTKARNPASSSTIVYRSPLKTSGWIPFDVQQGHIYLTAEIDGHKVPALLDSGASVTVINQSDAVRFGIRASDTEVGSGAQGSAASNMASGVTVSVGDLSIQSDRIAMPNLTGLASRLSHPLTVVLGGEFFSRTVLDIDFRARRLRFCDPGAATIPKRAEPVRLYNKSGLRFLDVSIEGHQARVMLDLGNGGAMNLTSKYWARVRLADGRRSVPSSIFGYGGGGKSQRVIVRTLRIGRITLASVPADILQAVDSSSSDIDGNVGLPVWSRFHLIMDFTHDRIFLVPTTEIKSPFTVDHPKTRAKYTRDGVPRRGVAQPPFDAD